MVTGEITLSIADVDLVVISLRALLTSVSTLVNAGAEAEEGAALVGAAFADASPAPSDMRSPFEINNASPPANAAVQAVKSDIRDRINAFMMSSNQGARSASTRDSLG